ncbi:MAG: hypothetical protein ACRC10_03085 [Thermoguttaceae bacterium]
MRFLRIKSILACFFLLLLSPFLAIFFGYLLCPVYDFAPNTPFSGPMIYNPYAGLDGLIPLKANFHAHSIAYKGLTDGQDKAEIVYNYYIQQGYDIPGLSNYQSIAPSQHDRLYIPLYEHGYGIFKFHQLGIGADSVVWQDFPLWSSLDNKQYLLDLVQNKAQVVALCHPAFTKFLSPDDTARLSNYDLIEVTRGEYLTTKHWDAVLSGGRLVFGISNDDSHRLSKEYDYLRRCNLIFVQEPTPEHVYQSLKKGKTIAILIPHFADLEKRTSIGNSLKTLLRNIRLDQDVLSVSLNEPAKRMTFIGQNGQVRHEVTNCQEGTYSFMPDDSYIRTEIEFDSGVVFLLNPFVRYNGQLDIYQNVNRMNMLKTVCYISIRLLVFAVVLYLLVRLVRLFRRRSPPIDIGKQ